jgi:CcmD family protein
VPDASSSGAETCPERQLHGTLRRERLKKMTSLGYLAAVNVVIWVGLFAYLWRLDRRVSEKERT